MQTERRAVLTRSAVSGKRDHIHVVSYVHNNLFNQTRCVHKTEAKSIKITSALCKHLELSLTS